MYCPRCGIENADQQRFCRACGLNLDGVANAVELDLSGNTDDLPSPRAQSGSLNLITYGLLLIVLGTVIITVGKKILSEQGVADIGTIVSVLGIGLLGWKGVFLFQQSRFSQVQKARPALEHPTARQATLPSGERPSITEQTTKQLDPTLESDADAARKTNPIQS